MTKRVFPSQRRASESPTAPWASARSNPDRRPTSRPSTSSIPSVGIRTAKRTRRPWTAGISGESCVALRRWRRPPSSRSSRSSRWAAGSSTRHEMDERTDRDHYCPPRVPIRLNRSEFRAASSSSYQRALPSRRTAKERRRSWCRRPMVVFLLHPLLPVCMHYRLTCVLIPLLIFFIFWRFFSNQPSPSPPPPIEKKMAWSRRPKSQHASSTASSASAIADGAFIHPAR